MILNDERSSINSESVKASLHVCLAVSSSTWWLGRWPDKLSTVHCTSWMGEIKLQTAGRDGQNLREKLPDEARPLHQCYCWLTHFVTIVVGGDSCTKSSTKRWWVFRCGSRRLQHDNTRQEARWADHLGTMSCPATHSTHVLIRLTTLHLTPTHCMCNVYVCMCIVYCVYLLLSSNNYPPPHSTDTFIRYNILSTQYIYTFTRYNISIIDQLTFCQVFAAAALATATHPTLVPARGSARRCAALGNIGGGDCWYWLLTWVLQFRHRDCDENIIHKDAY